MNRYSSTAGDETPTLPVHRGVRVGGRERAPGEHHRDCSSWYWLSRNAEKLRVTMMVMKPL
jgi:hypothetical protein